MDRYGLCRDEGGGGGGGITAAVALSPVAKFGCKEVLGIISCNVISFNSFMLKMDESRE